MPPNAAALKAGASISTSYTSASAMLIQNAAFGSTHAYYYGLTFQCTGAGSNGIGILNGSQAAISSVTLDTCTLKFTAANSGGVAIGNGGRRPTRSAPT